MYYQRLITDKLKQLGTIYPVVLVTGPRQAGKTELIRQVYRNHEWILLDSPQFISVAKKDPELFLQNYRLPIFIDEVQRATELFLQIKYLIDTTRPPMGSIILSGSQPFALMQKVSDSLAAALGF